ncbi:hypothetical protein D0Y65_007132 [Glycine soja]|uniref:Uncharacterized protein n=1 Tax=Glycine soja TaxID=3848 RepID=A0A445LBP0_GLYSO|nr:hypothetical protein D0Y65_007132 [Glycine soja]
MINKKVHKFCISHYSHFIGYMHTQEIRVKGGLWSSLHEPIHNSKDLKSVIFLLLRIFSTHHMFKVTSLFWCISHRRNEKLWENIQKPTCLSLYLATQFIQK